MTHKVNLIERVLTIRLGGKGAASDIQFACLSALHKVEGKVQVVLDLTLATVFDQSLKAMFFRVFQHGNVERIGVCSSNPAIARDVNELLAAVARVRPIVIGQTEQEVLVKLGLVDEPTAPRKMSGLLSFLQKDDVQPGTDGQ